MCCDTVKTSHPITLDRISKSYLMYQKPVDRLKQMLFRGRRRYFEEHHVLHDVSLTINKGETVGIVGTNGSGKSTLLQIICSTLTASSGKMHINGRISALLELGAGFNPEFTGLENARLNAAILGLSEEEIEQKLPEIEEFAAIGEMIKHPVKTYSSGMYVRLAFSVAIATDPDILVIDEALAVGDEAFQRKCFDRLRTIQQRGGTILFVSHSDATIIELCNRAILLDQGTLLCSGDPKSVVNNYHKLLYAPEEQRSIIRQKLMQGIDFGKSKPQNNAINPSSKESKEALFDPSLTPETQVSYASIGATITNPHIEDMEGNPVNILQPNQRYQYRYEVSFAKDAYHVKCGMMLKTKSGIALMGATTHQEGKEIPHVQAGEILSVQFIFLNLLNHGTYFTNAGCSAIINGERQSLHRILDAVMFKVQANTDSTITGMIDFQVESSVSAAS